MSFLDGLFGPPNVEKLKAKGDVDGLIKALHYEKDNKVRSAAAEALGEIGDNRAVEPLIAALKDSEFYVRWNAAKALGIIGDKRAVEPLVATLNDSGMRERAAIELGKIGDYRAVEPLIAMLKDKFWSEQAAKSLGEIKDTKAVELLITALKDSDSDVRMHAAEALGKIGDKRAIEPLIDALKDRMRERVRRNAAEALVKIGTSAVEQLVAALNDNDIEVCRSAADALDKIGWKPDKGANGLSYRIVKLIMKLDGGWYGFEWAERRNAAEALIEIYKIEKLNDRQKRLLLAQRDKIIEEHTDTKRHTDCGSSPGVPHIDHDHQDLGGIGVDFPI